MPKLLFILADRLSQLADKGEVTARYYNPGDVFDEVHLLTTSNDLVEPGRMAGAAGRARLHVHRLWEEDDRLQMALSPLLARRWARRAVQLARRHGIDVVRTGDRVTGYLGARVSRALNIPHLLSLHSHREAHIELMASGPRRWLARWERRYARYAIPRADLVLVVYGSLRDYAKAYGARRVQVVYNAVSPAREDPKADYRLHSPPRIISVGRQIRGKDPSSLVRALVGVEARLLLIGDGEAHEKLRQLVSHLGLQHRVEFVRSMPNEALCRHLTEYDLFAAQTDYPEIPKTVLEALWLGLPVVINREQVRPVPELTGDWVERVDNTAAGYGGALRRLLADEDARAALGRRGRRYAEATFAPRETEAQQAQIYRELLASRPRAATSAGGS